MRRLVSNMTERGKDEFTDLQMMMQLHDADPQEE